MKINGQKSKYKKLIIFWNVHKTSILKFIFTEVEPNEKEKLNKIANNTIMYFIKCFTSNKTYIILIKKACMSKKCAFKVVSE